MDGLATVPATTYVLAGASQSFASGSMSSLPVATLSLFSQIGLNSSGSALYSWSDTDVEAVLGELSRSPRFFQVFRTAFGDSFSQSGSLNLRRQWETGDFSALPSLQVRTSAELQGANSAFSVETNTVYIAQSYVQENASNRDAITGVLLEEIGHFIDAEINDADVLGDEGAIFSAVLQGVNLSRDTLQALKAEDDWATITLDGRSIRVEQSLPEVGDGLQGEYFNNANLTSLAVTRTDGTVNFNWGQGSPDGAIAPNTFSARWTGQVQAPTSGTYTFYTQSDDGIRLWVNGQRIINNWTNQAVTERSGTITLTAGQRYDIRLEYYENTGAAVARLLWSGPGMSKQIIPQSQLFSPSPDSTPPTVTATTTPAPFLGATTYDFTVTYADDVAVNAASLGDTDILVLGPNGFSEVARLVSVSPTGNGTPLTATYRITAPGGVWDASDNGAYTLALQASQVSDTSNNSMVAGPLGTIFVALASPSNGHGLRGEYFDNTNFTQLRETRIDSTVDFDWGLGSPYGAIAPDTFSVRWTGQIEPMSSGTYTFFTQSDDGVRLWVNNQLIINNWTDHAVTEDSGTITLVEGQKYNIRLEYYDSGYGAVAKLLWSGPGLIKQVIPQSQLFSSQTSDTSLPTATLAASTLINESTTPYTFSVTYSDDTAMNIAMFDSSDLLVTGPNGFSQMAALVRVDNSINGTPRTATYQIAPPDGQWDIGDNGTYSVLVQDNQIADIYNNFMAAGLLGTFSVSVAPPTANENIVFPADAGVLNVRDFGARGDGITDDTAAIQTALDAYPNGQRIIYLPNGTYLVSDTLNWPAGTPGTGNEYKHTILQGQSQNGVILRLRDAAEGFTDPNEPRSVIFTGPAPAQRFGNSIRNLTVDTGSGNPGAIGVQFNASNQGSMRQVTIRSGDGQGVNGLDMNFADEIGPLLIKGVTVNGFQYGIRTGYTVNSQTLENITLNNQSVYGFFNTGQIINIRGLTSNNAVTAIYNAGGRMTVLDSTLNGIGNASTQPAIQSDFPLDLVARNITTSGYQSAIHNAGTILPGPSVSEFVSGPIISQFPSPQQTLNLPIRETPDVPWDDPNTTPWANVVSFGAIPNDGLDDTAAIQAAIDSGMTTVYFPVGWYNLESTVLVRNNVRRITGTEASIDIPNSVNPGFRIVDGTSPIVVIERIQTGFATTPTVENASSRTLVLRDATNVSGNMTGPGDVFLENVVSNPFQSWTFNGQNVWARQFNVENLGTHIVNNGANLWIFGLKTERGGTLIDTRNGGRTELLGGLAYTTTGTLDGTQNDPMFINHESSISVTLGEINYGGGPPYTTYVRETRGGVTRDLSANALSFYMGDGKHIPLYVGY